jgi:hypothetical protein
LIPLFKANLNKNHNNLLVPTVHFLSNNNWVSHNFLAISICILIIQSLHIPKLPLVIVLMCSFLFLDVVSVITKNLLFTIGVILRCPIKIIIPVDVLNKNLSMMSLTDIIIPGIFIKFCLHYDIKFRGGASNAEVDESLTKYFNISLLTYTVGLTVAYGCLIIFQIPVPASFFVYPLMLGSVIYEARKSGDIAELWSFDRNKFH